MICTYEIELPRDLSEDEMALIANFESIDALVVERVRKGRKKSLDIRPLIEGINVVSKCVIVLELLSRSALPATKPAEALTAILGLDYDTALNLRVMKTSWSELRD